MSVPIYPILINAEPVQAADLAPLAFSGFAHFTAMQIRDRKVKGMDLHLARLRAASLTLFGEALPDETVLRTIRAAVANGPADMSLTATVYVPGSEFSKKRMGQPPSVLVRTSAPCDGPTGPLRLAIVEHERHQASIKHVGEGAKTTYLHRAIDEGFDDAAFVDRRARLTEATIWNLVFWDGNTVVWPRAELLTGTMMGIVQRQLARLGIPQHHREIAAADLVGLHGAAVMNSWTPGVAVTAIGQVEIAKAPAFMALLQTAFDSEPAIMVE